MGNFLRNWLLRYDDDISITGAVAKRKEKKTKGYNVSIKLDKGW